MANTTSSANMSLPIPVVGVDPGTDWASNLNACLTLIDSHDHAPGSGVQITPSGMNINTDLPFGNNSLSNAKTLGFFTQVADPSTLGCLYYKGVDLYFNDGSSNHIRITQSGSVAGASGTITGLPSGTASASYSSGSGTFVFQSATNTAANIDGGSFLFRNSTASSHSLTLSPPAAMGSDTTVTLPTIPAQTNVMTLTSGGAMGSITYDAVGQAMTATGANAIAATMTATGANAVAATMTSTGTSSIMATASAANANTLDAKRTRTVNASTATSGNLLLTASCGSYSTASTSFSNVTNLFGVIVTNGRPVDIGLVSDGTGSISQLTIFDNSVAGAAATIRCFRDGTTEIGREVFQNSDAGATFAIPTSSIRFHDAQPAGSYTYTIQADVTAGTTTLRIKFCCLRIYEL